MTRQEHLLIILAEECNEVAQRASKALRFGMEEVQPEQESSNAERLVQEFNDLLAVAFMLKLEGIGNPASLYAKISKVEKFLEYSKECGKL